MNKIIIEIPAEMANEVLPYVIQDMDSQMEMVAREAARQIQEQGYEVDINRMPDHEKLRWRFAIMAVVLKSQDIASKESGEPDMRLQHEYQLP